MSFGEDMKALTEGLANVQSIINKPDYDDLVDMLKETKEALAEIATLTRQHDPETGHYKIVLPEEISAITIKPHARAKELLRKVEKYKA